MWSQLATITVGCLLGACSLAVADGRSTGAALERIQVAADVDANSSSVTRLDFVFVYDPKIVAAMPKSSVDWFGERHLLVQTAATKIDVVSLEVPPSSARFRVDLPRRHRSAIKVLSYAGYTGARGQGVGDLTAWSCVAVILAAETPRYEPCD